MANDLTLLIEQTIASCTDRVIWVAYSGGVDSHVLLHLLASSKDLPIHCLKAIHIDHSLHDRSAQWAMHCEKVANNLGVDFQSIKVEVLNSHAMGVEAAARKVRYQAIAEKLSAQDIVLTAQHQEDQAETLLLQLLRGAGPKGLSAMSSLSSLGEGKMVRPFLNTDQVEIMAYAREHKLEWVDDPSNTNNQFNRNYLRHEVWPVIIKRWPSASRLLSRSAKHCAEADTLLADLAKLDLAAVLGKKSKNSLTIDGLLSLSAERCKNLLRYFIVFHQFSLPSATMLQRIIDEVCLSAEDSMPMIQWPGIQIRRYRGEIFFLKPQKIVNTSQTFLCKTPEGLKLFEGCILTWLVVKNRGISQVMFNDGLRVGFREGGEKIKLHGHQHHKSLKTLWQEWAVPPWERDRIPLLFYDNELIAVVGYGLSESCQLMTGQEGYLPLLKSV